MNTLPSVETTLRKAHGELSQASKLADLLYLLDVEPSGDESIVLYVDMKNGVSMSPEEKRNLEGELRLRLAAAGHPTTYFRWRVESESSASVTTNSGLRDKPVSALHP